MKINHNLKYVLYIILFIIFILIRINHILSSGEIEELGFKSLTISSAFWPFGIIKNTVLYDTFLPFYYLIIGILKNEILIKAFNILISLINVILFILIGKKIHSEKLGLFLGFLLSINHFFLYYSTLISPYCLIFLFYTLIVYFLIDYLKKPSKKNFKLLNVFNCILIFVDSFGFLFVGFELLFIYLLGKKKKIYQKHSAKLFNYSFISFLVVFIVLIIQYSINVKLVIPNTSQGVGLNFSSLYLLLSEYLTPYLSFMAPEYQAKTTMGLLYSFFLNPEIRNINSLKILITLFYSSLLPLFLMLFFSIKTSLKNYRFKILFLISVFNLATILFFALINKIDVDPLYSISYFIVSLILLGYGIFTIKDKFVKIIFILCLFLIQIINPEINSFNIKIKDNFSTLAPIKKFVSDFEISNNDIILMPHNSRLAKYYFKNLNFFNYDDYDLILPKKNGLINNLISKKTKTINSKNIHYLTKEYLLEKKTNAYLTSYFIENVFENENVPQRFILIVDKLNSKPISNNAIVKCANYKEYSPNTRKIDFRYMDFSQNQSQVLYDALKSKTLYNFAKLLNVNFSLSQIVEYKKIDNEYYKINSSGNIYKALTSMDSDYVFLIFR